MQAATHTNTHTCHYLYHSPCNANERLKCPSLYSTCCFAIPSKQHNTHTHNNTSTTHHATLFSLHAPVDTEPWAPWHDPQGIAAAHTNTPHTTQRKRATHMTQSIQSLGHHGMTLRALLQHTHTHTTQRNWATHMPQSIQSLGHHGMTLRALLQHTHTPHTNTPHNASGRLT